MEDRNTFVERVVWPHVRAAYNFARWLVRNEQDAEDIVQESFLKAVQAAHTLRGENARPWLLAIVRNTAMNFVTRSRPAQEAAWSDEVPDPADSAADPEKALIAESRRDRVRTAIERLPPDFRQTLVLREIEDMSYKEIGDVLKIPIGTVMSRLARARALLAHALLPEGGSNDLR